VLSSSSSSRSTGSCCGNGGMVSRSASGEGELAFAEWKMLEMFEGRAAEDRFRGYN
jgi:hypothetical protein